MENREDIQWKKHDKHALKTLTDKCLYFDDGRSSTIEAFMYHPKNNEWYEKYLERGFRRTGDIYYHSICEKCSSCIALRVYTPDFFMTNSQKKTYNANKDAKMIVRESYEIGSENVALYKEYMKKHGGSDRNSLDDLMRIHLGYPHTFEMDYFIEDRLVAVGIIDETKNALSSVYCYYDCKFEKRRLGIYTILCEIELAKEMKKEYYYLGYYIKELNAMSYKSSFKPNEALCNNIWQPL